MNRFPYRKTFILGLGFFGVSMIWPLFNNFVPIFLADLGLSATMVGFVMTWDNYINMFVQPIVGELSDQTVTRIGRRKPWMLVGAPIAAAFFLLVPTMRSAVGIMFAILLTNIGMALFRSPTVALLGDIFPSEQRSKANGVINLMGGLAAVLAFLVGGALYKVGRIAPFALGSLVLLAAILVVLLWVQEPKIPQPAEKKRAGAGFIASLREVLTSQDRSGLMILLAIMCWFMGYNALETWLSSFGNFSLGIDVGRMSIITSGFALLFVIFAVPSGLIATRFGRKRTIMVGIMGLTILFGFGWFIQNQAMLVGMLLFAGISWALININSLPMLYDVGGDELIGAFTGLYYFASSIAAVGGPQIVGVLVDLTGKNYRVMFLFSAFFMLLAGLCMSRVKESARSLAVAESVG